MGVIDFKTAYDSAMQAGELIDGSNVLKVIADNGDEIGETALKVVQGGNGSASEVWEMVKTVGAQAVAAGVAFMTISLPTAFAAIAPCLGVAAGVSIYELFSGDTDFHNRLLNALADEGKTVNGKVLAFFNGDNIFFDRDTIEIFKNELLAAGVFSNNVNELPSDAEISLPIGNVLQGAVSPSSGIHIGTYNGNDYTILAAEGYSFSNIRVIYATVNGVKYLIYASADSFSHIAPWSDAIQGWLHPLVTSAPYTWHDKTVYWAYHQNDGLSLPNGTIQTGIDLTTIVKQIAWAIVHNLVNTDSPYLQPGAVYPDEDPFPLRYPEWYPLNYPEGAPNDLPEVYPAKYPDVDPVPLPKQEPAQNPDPEDVPEAYPVIIPDLPLPYPNLDPSPDPNPNPKPYPYIEPTPDPDPVPTPDPIPDPEPTPNPKPIDPDPIDPNPTPDPSPTPIPIPLPDTVSSNKLFTVYNPTSAQLDALGGYLWDSNLMEVIKKIWQNPLDGIISLIQVYATPTTGGAHNIILGYLDSGVSAAVVTSQFVTVDCGSVQLKENKKNATDYSPFTSLHLYLPFVGIVELDVDECMKSTINVSYKVDMYTGTCLALVKITRSKDLPNGGVLYTFNGNCSQQLPLTSGSATGLLSGLLGAVGAGLTVASGGGLGLVAGVALAGQSLNSEMLHVSHSGNISANAGIMGSKKPYLIIGRSHGYDANGYYGFYGYPANKTINLGNTNGFVKVKDCHLQTSASDLERGEIETMLANGVIL